METRHAIIVVIAIGLVSLSPVIAASGAMGDGSHTTAAQTAPGRTAIDASPVEATQSAPPDPTGDTIGWEGGYWHNESITINQSDGLSASELDAFLARSMARVEYIRSLEFTEPVRIEFIHRDELNAPRNDTYGLATEEQLWEALFIYGENVNTSRTVQRAQRGVVLGFAAEEGSDHIVVVDPTPGRPTLSGFVLIHELAHMLQDQHFDLSRPRYQRHTLDGEFAKDGLVEGAAAYVTDRYVMNCGNEWQCVEVPSERSVVRRPAPFRFYRLTYFPYSAGEVYVRALVEQGGWSAVTAAYEQPPVSTEQVIHPVQTERPIPMTVTDTARNGWTRMDRRPETIGEAGIYTLLWRRSAADSPISEANLSRSGPTVGVYNYISQLSTGWANDRLYAYTKGKKRGYVWETVWDTERDAREFRKAYTAILKEEGATRRGPHIWRIEDGPFADAFAVRRNGTVVTIVNGPMLAALDDIHPPTATMHADGGTTNATTATTGPGFGGLVALLAVVLAGLAFRIRV